MFFHLGVQDFSVYMYWGGGGPLFCFGGVQECRQKVVGVLGACFQFLVFLFLVQGYMFIRLMAAIEIPEMLNITVPGRQHQEFQGGTP